MSKITRLKIKNLINYSNASNTSIPRQLIPYINTPKIICDAAFNTLFVPPNTNNSTSDCIKEKAYHFQNWILKAIRFLINITWHTSLRRYHKQKRFEYIHFNERRNLLNRHSRSFNNTGNNRKIKLFLAKNPFTTAKINCSQVFNFDKQNSKLPDNLTNQWNHLEGF